MTLSMNVVVLLYLVASVCFIQALKGLSHPTTSRRGNAFGMAGMAIAMATTIALIYKLAPQIATTGMVWVLADCWSAAPPAPLMANKVEMTKMPELVAFMHSMIGLAAVFIAIAAVAEPWAFGIAAAWRRDPHWQPHRARYRRVRWRDHVLRVGDRVRQAFRQIQISDCSRVRRLCSRSAHAEPRACDRHVCVRRVVCNDAGVVCILGDACDCVCAWGADHHSDWRRRYAGGGVDAE